MKKYFIISPFVFIAYFFLVFDYKDLSKENIIGSIFAIIFLYGIVTLIAWLIVKHKAKAKKNNPKTKTTPRSTNHITITFDNDDNNDEPSLVNRIARREYIKNGINLNDKKKSNFDDIFVDNEFLPGDKLSAVDMFWLDEDIQDEKKRKQNQNKKY